MQEYRNSLLTPGLLRELADAKPPCITMVVRTGGNPRARLADAFRELMGELEEATNGQADSAMPRLETIAGEVPDLNRTGSLIVLASPDFGFRFESADELEELVSAGDEFYLRPLVGMMNRRADFYLLALSQKHTRLLHCTESSSGEVSLPAGTPSDVNGVHPTRQPDHDLDNMATGGPGTGSMRGVIFGTTTEREDRDSVALTFLRAIDRGVNQLLHGTAAPLVVVATEHELALYQTVNTYPEFVAPGVHGAPDGLKGGEMHRRALELLQGYRPERVRNALEGFDKMAGTGHASSHAQEIVRAAYEGRVSILFAQPAAELPGTFDEVRQKVKRHEDGGEPLHDLINDAMVQTLRHGGEVHELAARDMPNGVPLCAIFRYAAPALQTAMRSTAGGSAQPV